MKDKRKKGLKFFVSFGILVLVAFSLIGCGKISTQVQSSQSEEVIEEHPIKIEDIDWLVEEGVIDGNRVIAFNYKNNSQYTITDLEIKFVLKEGTTAEQLAVFDKFKDDYKLSDEDVANIYILGSNILFADPGETVAVSPCTLNNILVPVENMEQYKLVEPDMATIDYIGKDGKLYEEYYDFKTQKYGDSTQGGKDMHEWSDSRICSRLPKADFREVIVSYDNEDYSFFFCANGVSREDFEAYIEACKEKGFTDDVTSLDYRFVASNADGYYVHMNYVAEWESMTCLIMIIE